MKTLATFVDGLARSGAVDVAENETPALTVLGLERDTASELARHLNRAGLAFRLMDAAEQNLAPDELAHGIAPYSVAFEKPHEDGSIRFLTAQAFDQWLSNPCSTRFVHVATCEIGYSTEAFSVCPWGETSAFSESRPRKSPRKVVRDASTKALVPTDLRPYLLAADSGNPSGDPIYEIWSARAAEKLVLSLATEVAASDKVEFVGPPRLSISRFDASATTELVDWLEPLQEIARWIYDIDRETELRHQLFCQEFARMAYGSASSSTAFARYGASALEGAKIAYSFHLNEISRDALKSLTELRKSVADDSQRLFDSARQTALGVAGGLFYVAGLIAARTASALAPLFFGGLLFVGMACVGGLVIISQRSLKQQRELRSVWRSRIYRYLTDSEYEEVVNRPAQGAERLLTRVLWFVTVVSAVTFSAAAWLLR